MSNNYCKREINYNMKKQNTKKVKSRLEGQNKECSITKIYTNQTVHLKTSTAVSPLHRVSVIQGSTGVQKYYMDNSRSKKNHKFLIVCCSEYCDEIAQVPLPEIWFCPGYESLFCPASLHCPRSLPIRHVVAILVMRSTIPVRQCLYLKNLYFT